MDITLARTFLEIVSGGSLMRAAERLHVTQTAVSARVKTLEQQVGRPLLVRNKAGASLTPAGERFLPHAATLVQVWERARQQVAVPPGRRAVLTVGCEISLWDPLMLEWLLWMRGAAPDLALRTEVGDPASLLNEVAEGTVEIAVVYAPRQRPGLRIDLLIEEKLVLVSTRRRQTAPTPNDYVHVDWGPEFAARLDQAFPGLSNAGVSASLGPLGLDYLIRAGGCGYFRLDAVEKHVDAGRLHVVKRAPVFMYPAYAVYSDSADPSVLDPALDGLRAVARRSAALPLPGAASTRPMPASR